MIDNMIAPESRNNLLNVSQWATTKTRTVLIKKNENVFVKCKNDDDTKQQMLLVLIVNAIEYIEIGLCLKPY